MTFWSEDNPWADRLLSVDVAAIADADDIAGRGLGDRLDGYLLEQPNGTLVAGVRYGPEPGDYLSLSAGSMAQARYEAAWARYSNRARSMSPGGAMRPGAFYLRIGRWRIDECSVCTQTGDIEPGVSSYEIADDRHIVVPDGAESALEDLRARLAGEEVCFLVQGRRVGTGHGGEPLLTDVVRVGIWPADIPAQWKNRGLAKSAVLFDPRSEPVPALRP